MALISSQSALGKAYATKIEALEKQIQTEGTKKQTELAKMDAAIKTLQDELEKQGSVLSAEAADKKRQDITRKARERQAFLEDGQQELQRMKERAEVEAQGSTTSSRRRSSPHIEAVAKEQGIDILLTSQVALTVNREFDISRGGDRAGRRGQDGRRAARRVPPAARPPAATPPAAAPTPAPTPRPPRAPARPRTSRAHAPSSSWGGTSARRSDALASFQTPPAGARSALRAPRRPLGIAIGIRSRPSCLRIGRARWRRSQTDLRPYVAMAGRRRTGAAMRLAPPRPSGRRSRCALPPPS